MLYLYGVCMCVCVWYSVITQLYEYSHLSIGMWRLEKDGVFLCFSPYCFETGFLTDTEVHFGCQ